MLRDLLDWIFGTKSQPPAPTGIVLRYENGNGERLSPVYIGRDGDVTTYEATVRRPKFSRVAQLESVPPNTVIRLRTADGTHTPDDEHEVVF